MKRFISLAIEELLLIILLLWMGWKYPERITSPNTLWVIGITTGLDVALAKLIGVLIDKKISRNNEQIQYANRIKRWTVCFALNIPIFFLVFCDLEYFGDMPATNRLLIILSAFATCDHLMLSHLFDVITGQTKGWLMDIAQENDIDVDIDEEL